jgi:excinuclease UvrABC nuclease subunit
MTPLPEINRATFDRLLQEAGLDPSRAKKLKKDFESGNAIRAAAAVRELTSVKIGQRVPCTKPAQIKHRA